jgi:hypothetical protein
MSRQVAEPWPVEKKTASRCRLPNVAGPGDVLWRCYRDRDAPENVGRGVLAVAGEESALRGDTPSKIRLSTPYYLLRKDVDGYRAAYDEGIGSHDPDALLRFSAFAAS